MCKRLVTPLGALLIGACASIGVKAEIPLAFNVSGQATYTWVKAGGERFSPSLFHFKGDLGFTSGLLDGIGIQGVFGVPMSNDERHGMTLEITEQTAAYVTLTNPEYEAGDLKVTVLLGYATTEIEAHLPRLGGPVKDSFSGFSYGFSLQDPIMENKPLYWTLDCVRSYRDDDLRVDGCGLGVTYAF
jgi:hypothetical protein